MDKPGEMDMVVGPIWAVVGVATMVGTVLYAGMISMWSFVAIGIGVVQFGRGFTRRHPDAFKSSEELRLQQAQLDADALLRALVYTAADNGKVSFDRAARIKELASAAMQGRQPQIILPFGATALSELADKEYDLRIFVERAAPKLVPAWREAIDAACANLAGQADDGPPMTERAATMHAALRLRDAS